MALMAEADAARANVSLAFEDFFGDQHERLLRAMYLATGDRHEAEDLAQEAFVRIYERLPDGTVEVFAEGGMLVRGSRSPRRTWVERFLVGPPTKADRNPNAVVIHDAMLVDDGGGSPESLPSAP